MNEAQRGSGRALRGLGARPRRHGFTCRPQLTHCCCGLHQGCQAPLTGPSVSAVTSSNRGGHVVLGASDSRTCVLVVATVMSQQLSFSRSAGGSREER